MTNFIPTLVDDIIRIGGGADFRFMFSQNELKHKTRAEQVQAWLTNTIEKIRNEMHTLILENMPENFLAGLKTTLQNRTAQFV